MVLSIIINIGNFIITFFIKFLCYNSDSPNLNPVLLQVVRDSRSGRIIDKNAVADNLITRYDKTFRELRNK